MERNWRQTRLGKLFSLRSLPGLLISEEGVSGGALFKYLWRQLENLHTLLWLRDSIPLTLSQWIIEHSMRLNWFMFLCGVLWLSAVVWGDKIKGSSSPAIFGSAEFLAVRIGPNDNLRVALDWKHYIADIGVFVRMTVAASGKAKTIPAFVIRIEPLSDGKPTEGVAYQARSERNIGEFVFHHYEHTVNDIGYAVERTVLDSMPDLVEKLQTPLQPESHVDGWVRFEVKDVAHEIEECRITIYAEDVHKKQYEIEAAKMIFANLKAHEYVIPKPPRPRIPV